MATTIKLKNGSGAPLAGDLVQGEPALDLSTNPTSLTTGTFTSTGIDDNATSTAITIDSNQVVLVSADSTVSPNMEINRDSLSSGDGVLLNLECNNNSGTGNILRFTNDDPTITLGNHVGEIQFFSDDAGAPNSGLVASFQAVAENASGDSAFTWKTGGSEAMRIDSSGNVGIGTTSPDETLVVQGGVKIRGTNKLSFTNTSDQTYIQAASSNVLAFGTDSTERMRIDSSGNLMVGITSTPTSSAGNIVLGNGTAPTASATGGVILYAEDVSSSSELKVRDEAGNITTLSPHNFDLIPQGPSEDMAWSYYSERDGKQINVDMLKAIRVLEKLSGEQLVFEN
jgi:hypothetical protein